MYILENTKSGNSTEEFFHNYEDVQRHLSQNPDLILGWSSRITITSGRIPKPDNEFRSLLKEIKKGHATGKIETS